MAEEINLPKSFEKTMEKVAAASKKPSEAKAKQALAVQIVDKSGNTSLLEKVATSITGNTLKEGGTKGTEKNREDAAAQIKRDTVFGSMLKTLGSMDNSLAKILKSMTKETLGGIIGLIAAPIIAVVAFFSQLKKEWIALKLLANWFKKTSIGRTLALFMKPFQLLYDLTIGRVFKAFTNNINSFKTAFKNIGKTLGGFGGEVKISEFKNIGGKFGAKLGQLNNWFKSIINIKDWPKLDIVKKVTKPFKDLALGFREIGKASGAFGSFGNVKKVKDFTGFFQKIGAFFGSISKFVAGSKVLASIGSIAGTVGRIMGKVFLPITILMGIFDFVTGFMKGKEEGGILEGFKQGITKLFNGLISMPLDFLTKGVAWLLEKMGFDKTAKVLKDFSFAELFTKMIGGIFDAMKAIIDWAKLLFSDPVKALKVLWKNLVGAGKGIADWIFDGIKPVIDWFKNLFDFDFGKMLKDKFPTISKLLGGDADKKLRDKAEEMGLYEDNKWSKDTINKERLEEAFDQKKISADMLKAILAEKDLTKEDTAFMEKLVKRATSPGSIFTHDQGLHDRLDALGQGGTFSAAGTVISDKSIKDLVKALQENSNGGSGGGTNINAPQTNISSAPTTTIGAQVAPRQRVAVNG